MMGSLQTEEYNQLHLGRLALMKEASLYNFIHEINFMDSIKALISEVVKFRNERDWEQFHNSKDLAIAISIESGELNELFLWKKAEEVNIEKLKEELADIFTFSFLLADKHNLDIYSIVTDKLRANAVKYPVDKAKGTAKKYNEL